MPQLTHSVSSARRRIANFRRPARSRKWRRRRRHLLIHKHLQRRKSLTMATSSFMTVETVLFYSVSFASVRRQENSRASHRRSLHGRRGGAVTRLPATRADTTNTDVCGVLCVVERFQKKRSIFQPSHDKMTLQRNDDSSMSSGNGYNGMQCLEHTLNTAL